MIAFALRYVRMGYRVLPCVPNHKRPVATHGLEDASGRPELVCVWWRDLPNANLGLLPPARVLVLDAGSALAADHWEATHAELRAAPKVRTPRGGAHYYLQLIGATRLQARVRAGPEEVPVGLHGLGKSHVLVPPSRTPRGSYHWERPLLHPEVLPAASPELLQRLQPRTPTSSGLPILDVHAGGRHRRAALRALMRQHDRVAASEGGSRHDALARAACGLGRWVARGLLLDEEVEMTLLAAATACGLPSDEARRTVTRGLRAGMHAAPKRDVAEGGEGPEAA